MLFLAKYLTMENNQKPVDNYVSQKEHCCQQSSIVTNNYKPVYANIIDVHARGNPKIDNNIVKGYN